MGLQMNKESQAAAVPTIGTQRREKQPWLESRQTINKMEEQVGLGASVVDSGKGKSKIAKNVTHGYHLVRGTKHDDMEDYIVSEFKQVEGNELGLFAIFDGHLSCAIPDYLRKHLFENIITEPDFWRKPQKAMRRAYHITDKTILEKAGQLGKGGSTAVTAILINCEKLVVANLGDSRAIIYKNGVAEPLSIDYEPMAEKEEVEDKGGFVSNFPGDVPRVDGQLAMSRSFGDKSLKQHLSSEPDITVDMIDEDADFIILASDGLWTVMSNQEAADTIANVRDARTAAKRLVEEALDRGSKDDISCIVVKFL